MLSGWSRTIRQRMEPSMWSWSAPLTCSLWNGFLAGLDSVPCCLPRLTACSLLMTFGVVIRYAQGHCLDELIKMESAGVLRLSWEAKRNLLRQLVEVVPSLTPVVV
jgi:hypothetical protein